jgi:hypothetical protein
MRMSSLLVAILAFASVAAFSASGAGTSLAGDGVTARTGQVDEISAAKRKKRPRATSAYGRASTQIACTRLGCNPIPPGCQIRTQFTWSGLPSGFDAVVCPYR